MQVQGVGVATLRSQGLEEVDRFLEGQGGACSGVDLRGQSIRPYRCGALCSEMVSTGHS